MTGTTPLAGLRVVDLSTWIAGGYCTKLLADGGADVVKVDAEADPLRRWSASGATIPADADGALFTFLHAAKRRAAAGDDLDALLAGADLAVWSKGSPRSPAELLAAHPHLVVTAITPFGLDGPWADRPATEFTLQAWSGATIGLGRGSPDRPPVHVGGQIGEWLAGAFAAVGALAALRRRDTEGELVDVSMLEVLAACLTYHPVTFADQLGRPFRPSRFVPVPGVAAAEDGIVGLGSGTGQQWLDFCVMVGHPEWQDDATLLQQIERVRLAPDVDAWVAARTVDEVLDTAAAFRIPCAPVANGETVTEIPHFRERGCFVTNPVDGVTNPRPPWRFRPSGTPGPGGRDRPAGPLPFSGLRVLDLTSFWAGPFASHVLAQLGAEVIHVEGPNRPDGARLIGGIPPGEDHAWEKGPIFAALNTNKKSLALDLRDPDDVDRLRRVAATCDVLIENYTPRVLEQLGLDTLLDEHPGLIVVRMPGFGLDGPWRDAAAFAFVIEDASGLTWLTGYPDELPVEPYCVGDPNAGLHAVHGLLLALAHRDRTGEGGLVEAAAVDAALSIAAEQVIEHSAYGALLQRAGNRGPCAAPQGVYRAAGDDAWVAIAVATDDQWAGLRRALGDPEWARDPSLATAAGRAAAHDALDARLDAWCRDQPPAEIVERLWAEGVPVGEVVQPHRQGEVPQLRARGWFEELDHPVAGRARYATLPFRLSRGPARRHTRHAPLLGEHNAELLAAEATA